MPGPCRVLAPPNRKFLPWLGGSKLSQLDQLEEVLVWQDEWEERGDAIFGDHDTDLE